MSFVKRTSVLGGLNIEHKGSQQCGGWAAALDAPLTSLGSHLCTLKTPAALGTIF